MAKQNWEKKKKRYSPTSHIFSWVRQVSDCLHHCILPLPDNTVLNDRLRSPCAQKWHSASDHVHLNALQDSSTTLNQPRGGKKRKKIQYIDIYIRVPVMEARGCLHDECTHCALHYYSAVQNAVHWNGFLCYHALQCSTVSNSMALAQSIY